jgi:prepilin-type N-terminal cleavage/methylation domain-containing protein
MEGFAVIACARIKTYEHNREPRGFSLVELLVVCLIIAVLTTLTFEAVAAVQNASLQAQCGNRLKQLGQGFTTYRGEYRKFPMSEPPLGFGDRHNWQDLWSHADPGGTYFSAVSGNKTDRPRVPRFLETYVGQVEVLHCSTQGASAWWPDVGPYFYNTTSPFDGTHNRWISMYEENDENPAEPLAACQNPIAVTMLGSSWRHGEKESRSPDGANNHLYVTGAVRSVNNPIRWTDE